MVKLEEDTCFVGMGLNVKTKSKLFEKNTLSDMWILKINGNKMIWEKLEVLSNIKIERADFSYQIFGQKILLVGGYQYEDWLPKQIFSFDKVIWNG